MEISRRIPASVAGMSIYNGVMYVALENGLIYKHGIGSDSFSQWALFSVVPIAESECMEAIMTIVKGCEKSMMGMAKDIPVNAIFLQLYRDGLISVEIAHDRVTPDKFESARLTDKGLEVFVSWIMHPSVEKESFRNYLDACGRVGKSVELTEEAIRRVIGH